MRTIVSHPRLILLALVLAAFGSTAVAGGPPNVAPPGPAMEVPPLPTAPGAPQIYEQSQAAGPDETFIQEGKDQSSDLFVWGGNADDPAGRPVQARIQLSGEDHLAATLSERAVDGPFVVAVKNKAGYSAPIVLNAPQPWWCSPNEVLGGGTVRVFGRNLSRRPDGQRALVYLVGPDGVGRWVKAVAEGKYALAFPLPDDVQPGTCDIWLHAGHGGSWGWGGPLKLDVRKPGPKRPSEKLAPSSPTGLQQAIDSLGQRGGGTLKLPEGIFSFTGTLRIPAGETLSGDSHRVTVLQLETSPASAFAKDGRWPGGDRAAVWLAGDDAGIEDLTVLGNPQVNLGIAVRSPDSTTWLSGCRVAGVKVADCEGKQGENCGIHLRNVRRGIILGNELWGRTPVFLSGVRQTEILSNRLVSVTRFGGNAEAAILGRTEPIEECVIEGNLVASPPGAEAGGPTARRLIWLSTGHGSVVHNYLAHNGVDADAVAGPALFGGVAGQARFGGVAGTDQNVGEMILFEGNHRTAYFGRLAGGDDRSVTLPRTLDPTPDDRLGSVRRDQLAHDAKGRETPFWPPDADDGTQEPPISEYFVTVFSGPGWGQTRRVVRREGPRLLLDRPWRVAPGPGSVVAVGVMFHQNLIVGNDVSDGMTGIQLWISCVENIVSGNTITRQRKPGLFFYGNGTTLASSMPRTWNRGISPLFWNLAEGNRVDECSDGALVTSGDAPNLPIEFPRALGNVLRHNSFLRSRGDGVILTSRKGADKKPDTAASIFGTIAEFNVVRDAVAAYHAAQSCDAVVWRRNHAYFWHPANNPGNPPVAFQSDDLKTTIAAEANTVEGTNGVPGRDILLEKKPAEGKK